MAQRTFAFGDLHGELPALYRVLSLLPELDAEDTLVFLGDYIDCGPKSAEVVAFLRELPKSTPAKVVWLRGNHEDAWLKVREDGWAEFVLPASNGCLPTLRSFRGEPPASRDDVATREELRVMMEGRFFPDDVLEWMRDLPHWYEDEHAIYVHAGLPHREEGFAHPAHTEPKIALLWCRDRRFFEDYRGKRVVVGHTVTETLPQELSTYTPEDPSDLWAGPAVIAIDTGCGKGGFLTCVELPSGRVYESR